MICNLKKKGRFITIEGIEGAGKSTQIKLIESFLNSKNIPYIATREPGGTPLAELIRKLIIAQNTEAPTAITELLLVFSARAQHLEKKIVPALEAGTWVVCDRFTDASYAYQGGGREISLSSIKFLESLVQGEFKPDLTFFLDLSIINSRKRVGKRTSSDRIEKEQDSFFERVRNTYFDRISESPERYCVVDACLNYELINSQIVETISRQFEIF